MNSRIRELRKALHLSQNDFAARIGLKQNAVSCMEIDGATITRANIKLICLEFSVNEDWLVNGEGEMFVQSEKNIREFISLYKELSPEFQDYILRITRELLHTQQIMAEHSQE